MFFDIFLIFFIPHMRGFLWLWLTTCINFTALALSSSKLKICLTRRRLIESVSQTGDVSNLGYVSWSGNSAILLVVKLNPLIYPGPGSIDALWNGIVKASQEQSPDQDTVLIRTLSRLGHQNGVLNRTFWN